MYALHFPPAAAVGMYLEHMKAAQQGTGNETSVVDKHFAPNRRWVSDQRLLVLSVFFKVCTLRLSERGITLELAEEVATTAVMWLTWRYKYLD